MRSSSERINISTIARKLDVDNRYSLRFYHRVADNILKQADIFREERNIIDLYVMLLRFSSLASETIPCHRDYRASPQSKKMFLKKKLLHALEELEVLKPAVRQKLDELNKKHTNSNSLEWPLVKNQTVSNYDVRKAVRPPVQGYTYQGSMKQQFSYSRPVAEQLGTLSLSMYRPKEETLSKHSILGPNGLRAQWQPPKSDKGVRYPSNIDLSPIEMPRLQLSLEDEVSSKKDYGNLQPEKPNAEPILIPNEDSQMHRAEEPDSMISFESEATETPMHSAIIRQPSPPPVLAEVQDLIPTTSPQVSEANCGVAPQVSEANCGVEKPVLDGFGGSEAPLELHISTAMMEGFMKLAKSNTDKNLETCGILAGSLKNRKFYITALIIPKQESTSDSCQATNEEEIFEVQDKLSLFPLGWIHTHPTQSCFMSSIDIHTHYSYQIMLPESVAIVMAPRDSSRTHGIFRLTTPGGMSVIRNCQLRGFHPHNPPPDGGPLYKSCTDVYMNPNLKFDVHDLR